MSNPIFYGNFFSHFDEKGRGVLRKGNVDYLETECDLYFKEELWGFKVRLFDEEHEKRMLNRSENDEERLDYFQKGRKILLENNSGVHRFNLGKDYASGNFIYQGNGDRFNLYCMKVGGRDNDET